MTRPQRTDALIVAALLVAVVVEQGLVYDRPVSMLLNAAGCVALVWRRAVPVASTLTAMVLFGGPEFVERNAAEAFAPMIGMIVALFSLVAYAAPRRAVPATLAAVVLFSVVSVQTSLDEDTLGGALAGAVLFAVVVMALPAIAVGAGVRRQAELRRQLEMRARELEAERERHAAAAADEERSRIAGELHDLVAAGVQSMLADLSAARRAVIERPQDAAPAILVVEERGREALTEMRGLLGVLRRGDEDLALAPHPSLERLDALARHRSGTGPAVSLRVEGAPQRVSAGLDVAAYRVVEEALDRAPVTGQTDVLVRWAPRHVVLEIAVDGPDLADADALGAIRERVALFSGRLDTGRRPHGRSAMRALLPLGSSS